MCVAALGASKMNKDERERAKIIVADIKALLMKCRDYIEAMRGIGNILLLLN